MMPGRQLLDVVGDQHRRGRVRVGGEPGEPAQQVLAAAEVHAGGRLVEQQQLRVGHQRPRDLHPLALALAQRAERALGEVADAEPVEQRRRAAHVDAAVGLAPAAEHRRSRR